jgi:membrane protease YdiL (CAAX protease family)
MGVRRQWESLGEVVLCSGYPTQLAIGGGLHLAGVEAMTPEGGLSLTFLVLIGTFDTVLLLALIAWLTRRRGESLTRLFFGHRPPLREALLGVALAPAVLGIITATMLVIRLVAPTLRTVPENPLEALARSREGLVIMLAMVTLAGGVREELQRAFLLDRFRQDLGGATTGLLITSVGFGVGHLLQGWDAVIVTGLLGLLWGVVYLRRGSTIAPMVSHALANAVQVVVAHLKP